MGDMKGIALEWVHARKAGLLLCGETLEGRPLFRGTPEQLYYFSWLRTMEALKGIKSKIQF